MTNPPQPKDNRKKTYQSVKEQGIVSKNVYNPNLLLGAALGIALVTGVLGTILADTSPITVVHSGELEEAERLMEQADEFFGQGNYGEAIPLAEKALAIREKGLGSDHLDVAQNLSSLAALYFNQGNYAQAEPLYQRSLAIRQKALGPDHPDVAQNLSGLAGLHLNQGNYAQAERLFQRSLAIREKVLGSDHRDVANSLNNFAAMYLNQGSYAKAEPLLQRALAIWEKALGPDHPDVATGLYNLAAMYLNQDSYAEAEPLFQRSLTIREKALGADHPDVANSLHHLALIYGFQGNYAEAESLYQRSLAIREKVLGPDHLSVAHSLHHLAVTYGVQGEIKNTIDYATRALNVQEYNIALNLVLGSERHKRTYMATFFYSTHGYVSIHLHSAPNNLQAARLALTTILQRKGRILDAVSNNLQTIRDNLTSENQALLEQLSATRSQIASAVFAKEPPPGIDLTVLQQKAEQLETQLAAASAEYQVESEPVTIEAVQELIPDDAVLVELIYYKPINSTTSTSGFPRYAAYILHSKGDPQWVDLGEATPIEELAKDFRKALRQQPLAPGERPRLTGQGKRI